MHSYISSFLERPKLINPRNSPVITVQPLHPYLKAHESQDSHENGIVTTHYSYSREVNQGQKATEPQFPLPRRFHASCTHKNLLFFCCGFTIVDYRYDLYVLNVETGALKELGVKLRESELYGDYMSADAWENGYQRNADSTERDSRDFLRGSHHVKESPRGLDSIIRICNSNHPQYKLAMSRKLVPSSRSSALMVHDEQENCLYLFGGWYDWENTGDGSKQDCVLWRYDIDAERWSILDSTLKMPVYWTGAKLRITSRREIISFVEGFTIIYNLNTRKWTTHHISTHDVRPKLTDGFFHLPGLNEINEEEKELLTRAWGYTATLMDWDGPDSHFVISCGASAHRLMNQTFAFSFREERWYNVLQHGLMTPLERSLGNGTRMGQYLFLYGGDASATDDSPTLMSDMWCFDLYRFKWFPLHLEVLPDLLPSTLSKPEERPRKYTTQTLLARRSHSFDIVEHFGEKKFIVFGGFSRNDNKDGPHTYNNDFLLLSPQRDSILSWPFDMRFQRFTEKLLKYQKDEEFVDCVVVCTSNTQEEANAVGTNTAVR